jgi:membrane protein DedA with SNARE-associated domain
MAHCAGSANPPRAHETAAQEAQRRGGGFWRHDVETWLAQLAALHDAPAYALVFALLVACGIGAPLNEDVVLLVAAALTLTGVMEPPALIVVAWFGLLLGDGLVFHWGRRFGPRILGTRFFSRIVSPSRLAEFQGRVRRGGTATVFLIRFMPGVRTALYFAAGTLKIPYRTFLVFDGLAAAVELPLLVYGVRLVGGRWREIMVTVERLQVALLIGVAAVVVAVLGVRALKRRASAAQRRRR